MNRIVEASAGLQEPARIAIDLGAKSCRLSLLRWQYGKPAIELIHRFANAPVHRGASLRWPLETILTGTVGLALKEWKGLQRRTVLILLIGMLVIIAAA